MDGEVGARLEKHFSAPVAEASQRAASPLCKGPEREQCELCGHTVLC